jgi:hypothetical protein
MPSTGTTHQAPGLATRGCRAGHRVLVATASAWIARAAEAHHAGRPRAGLIKLGRYPLLVDEKAGTRIDTYRGVPVHAPGQVFADLAVAIAGGAGAVMRFGPVAGLPAAGRLGAPAAWRKRRILA